MFKKRVQKIKKTLTKYSIEIFNHHPVLFAYLYGSYATGLVHTFSDLDIGIYVEKNIGKESLEIELSLALEIDERLDRVVSSEVRIINHLPLIVLGKIITEGILIFSKKEAARVDFETSVRSAYFDFLPVIKSYQNAYLKSHIS